MTNPDNVGGLLESAESIRRLAGVIRQYGTCAPSALETVADRIAELCRAAPAGGDDQKDYEMDKTIYDLAIHCGADVDGGECPDHSANFAGSPPTITFTDRQLEKFVEKIIDGSWLYKDFVKDERPLTASDLRDM